MRFWSWFLNKAIPRKRGGYLAFYGLWEWYDSQPKEVQDYLYESCGCGINTNSRNLTEGIVEVLKNPDDEYPWTATKFLCQHAMNAVRDKKHSVCHALLDGAFRHAKSMKDSIYHGLISQKIAEDAKIYPDQDAIDIYKPVLYQLVKDNPGILQSDIKKHFPPDMENITGLAHWANVQDGKVKRVKKGRSFQLFIQEGL